MTRTVRLRCLASLALVVAVTLAACSDSDGPSAPRGRFEQHVALRAGQILRIESEGIDIGFEQVTQDSRCPIDAICIQAGEARGRFGLGTGRPASSGFGVFELSTLSPRTRETGVYRITLEWLIPLPTGQPIPPGDYVAELFIERVFPP